MLSRRNSLFSLVSAAALMLLTAGAQADTISVSAGQSIQEAIDAAAPDDTILIGPGTYYENLQWNDKDLVIKGAGAGSTIINANLSGQGYGGACVQTNGLSSDSRLEGVTLTGGRIMTHLAEDWYSYVVDAWGGGMRNVDSSPTVVNCAFVSNDGTGTPSDISGDDYYNGYGGGMYNLRSNPAVSGCTFQGNVADFGGAIYNENAQPTFTACSVQGDPTAMDRGDVYSATSTPTFTACTFVGVGLWNRNPSFGANPSGATITGCTFRNIHQVYNDHCNAPGVSITNCVFDGCPHAVYNDQSTVTITNSSFINSLIQSWGPGQIYSASSDLTLTGCLIANNTNLLTDVNRLADIRGVAIWASGSLRMTNCTVANNTGGQRGAGLVCSANATITNCIFWNNRGTVNPYYSLDDQNVYVAPHNFTVVMANCDIDRSAVYPGAGNTNANPLLVNPANGDFRLLPSSPCVNTGSSAAVPPDLTTDLDGLTRISGSSVDMGCYERIVYSWSGVLQPINADGSSVFKAGRVVPVRFALTGASAGITNLNATLTYAKLSGNVPGPVNEADTNGTGDSGNGFRYDAASGQYAFNWNTKGMTPGCYRLYMNLGDGVQRYVDLALR